MRDLHDLICYQLSQEAQEAQEAPQADRPHPTQIFTHEKSMTLKWLFGLIIS